MIFAENSRGTSQWVLADNLTDFLISVSQIIGSVAE